MNLIKVGDTAIHSVLETTLQLPVSRLKADPALIEANRHWLSPYFLQAGETWSLEFRSWILHVDDKIVVVDPCTGNGRPNPMASFDMLDIPFLERFCETGIRPEDVDYVFCTHLHHDHCGWNTQLRDGRWVPTFPNARYIFVKREYERWDPNGVDYRPSSFNEGVYERSVKPIVEAGLADLVLERHRILPSLEIEPANGHTLAHSMLRLMSGRDEALFTGDAFHFALQLTQPELQFGGPDDPPKAIETRRRIVALGLERGALIIPAHFPFPHAGRLRRDNTGLVFEALA